MSRSHVLRLLVFALPHQFSHPGQVFPSLRVGVVVGASCPDSLFVELQTVGGRSAVDHRSQPAVAQRQCFRPHCCRLVIPQYVAVSGLCIVAFCECRRGGKRPVGPDSLERQGSHRGRCPMRPFCLCLVEWHLCDRHRISCQQRNSAPPAASLPGDPPTHVEFLRCAGYTSYSLSFLSINPDRIFP